MPKYTYSKLKLKQVTAQLKNSSIQVDDFGSTVKDIREALGMSQKQLAKRTSLTQQAIQQIENGKNSPTIATMQKIASAINGKITFRMNIDGSLEDVIKLQANNKAEIMVNNASTSMAIEKQNIGDSMHKSKIKEVADEFIQNPLKGLWDE